MNIFSSSSTQHNFTWRLGTWRFWNDRAVLFFDSLLRFFCVSLCPSIILISLWTSTFAQTIAQSTTRINKMVCSFCHSDKPQPHNTRTCQKYNVAKITQMMAENEAESVVCRAIDGSCPGIRVFPFNRKRFESSISLCYSPLIKELAPQSRQFLRHIQE